MQKTFSFIPLLTVVMATAPLLAATNLDQQMTLQEKQQTGVVNLTLKQKQALALWIDARYTPITESQAPSPQPNTPAPISTLTLNVNVQNGQQLILSDGTRWQVHPQDVKTSSIWLTPIPITVKKGTDPNYPYVITNQSTNQSIRAKPIAPAPTP
jgi:hypothetical protein